MKEFNEMVNAAIADVFTLVTYQQSENNEVRQIIKDVESGGAK